MPEEVGRKSPETRHPEVGAAHAPVTKTLSAGASVVKTYEPEVMI